MRTVRDIDAIRQAVREARQEGRRVGFVPTMGALHAGHLSLVEVAKRSSDFAVVSIFVNPTQFGPNEDFNRYPRDEARDTQLCADACVDVIFIPPVEAMYPPGALTRVCVTKLTDTLCGPHRPGHFDGVALIVAKLFNIVQPDVAFFGEKDAQQLAVIRRMTRDLDLPVEIVGCPTMREPDGLAMSSRNAYLSREQRQQALSLSAALFDARRRFEAGERDVKALERSMREMVERAGPATIDYISVVDAETLQPIENIERSVLAALAVRIGGTRLIDNVTLAPTSAKGAQHGGS